MDSARRHVVCAVDLSSLSRRELDAAVEMAALLRARLAVLHHEHDAPSAMTTTWDWRRDHPEARTTDAGVTPWLAEAFVRTGNRVPVGVIRTTGRLGTAIESVVRMLHADLLLLGNHGASTPEHRSLTERAITRQTAAVLVVHDDDVTGREFRLRRSADEPLPIVLVAVDFGPTTAEVVRWLHVLAATAPLDLHLLHVLPTVTTLARAAVAGRLPADLADDAAARLRSLLPDDYAGRSTCSVEWGAPAEVITAYADRVGPDLVVLGQRAQAPWMQLATGDTARAVLHRAWCPLLFVPKRDGAAAR